MVASSATATFRAGRAEDREPILDLLQSAFSFRELFARYMDEMPDFAPDDFLLACEDGRPEVRGRGLASELMRRAADVMRERGAALALLFTGRFGFYAPLGWHQVPRHGWVLRRPWRTRAAPADIRVRPFADDDLPAVRALYDAYAADVPATTVRDERYWSGQLRYAGNPDEDFRLAERDGRVVAYARGIALDGLHVAMEYARAPDAAEALAAALESLLPRRAPLVVPGRFDPALEPALAARGLAPKPGEDPSPMWKALDRDALRRLAGAPEGVDDAALLERLAGGPRAVFWPSDRF